MERVFEALAPELPASALYGILKLRAEVFVVEQACVYLDPDGRDLEASTRHLWIEADDGVVVSALRVLVEADGASALGRVATAPAHRSLGLGTRLLERAIEVAPRPLRINAQSHLTSWYEDFGFVLDGEAFLEDGIAHAPMVRTG